MLRNEVQNIVRLEKPIFASMYPDDYIEILEENLPNVKADSEKTAWILTNLISNAVRYSYENSTIFLTIITSNDKIIFSVKDTGQGIPSQFHSKIFDKYFRVPGTQKEGTGLGLAISKEFVEAQGGEITVDSEVGSGSVFQVILNQG